MNVKDYLLKINKICEWNEGNCRKGGCPLHELGCGNPKDADIGSTIEIVERYEEKTFPFGYCKSCGKEFNSELINEYEIKNCPWCGEKVEVSEC